MVIRLADSFHSPSPFLLLVLAYLDQTNVNIPDCIILESYTDYLVQYKAQTLKKASKAFFTAAC